MPRGRFLSKSISLDEGVNSLPNDTARLLFTWLIPHLDCEGRLHGDATTVKSIIFPRRSISTRKVDQYLNAIEKSGLIVRYSVNGNAYLFAPHFEKHQMGLQKDREAQSQIPPFTPDLIQISSKKTLTQVKGKVEVKVKGKDILAQKQDASNDFEIFWRAYPKRKSKGDAEKAFAKVRPDETLFATILAKIEESKTSDDWLKDDGKYIPYPATWLNAKGWEDEVKRGGQDGKARQSSRTLPKHYRTPEEIFGKPESDA